jgi:hypothetical protein
MFESAGTGDDGRRHQEHAKIGPRPGRGSSRIRRRALDDGVGGDDDPAIRSASQCGMLKSHTSTILIAAYCPMR